MNLCEQLKRDEGLKLTAYHDSLGKVTVGYGRCLETKGITRDEAEYLLANDIAEVTISLAKAIPWMTALDEPRRAVLQNMAFNLGVPGVLKFANTLACIKAGDFNAAADAMLASKWATQVGDRAKRLAEQMRTGEWK